MNAHWIDRLSEYLDGELSAGEHAACEAHLRTCADCAGTLDELRAVIEAARADADLPPATDLWPGVAARLDPPAGSGRFGAARRTRVTFTLPQLALAASLLAAVAAGVTHLAGSRWVAERPTNGTAAAGAGAEMPIRAQAETLDSPAADVQRANFADATFDRAVADLEEALAEMRDELDPRTVAVLERNLTTIDEAIREARAALEADPANTFLNSHLADARRKKLDLLRRATMLPAGAGD